MDSPHLVHAPGDAATVASLDFPEPRDVIPLPPSVVAVFAARHHRLHHAVWHSVRQMWSDPELSGGQRARIESLGWKPARPATEYTTGGASKRPCITNGSGEDFLFMHRQMIAQFRSEMRKAGADPMIQWVIPPDGGAPVSSGYAVPPAWEEPPTSGFGRRIAALKTDEYYWSRMRWWDREFKDPTRLRGLTLGELGSLIEFSIHNDMHMRWSSEPRDPAGTPGAREDWDIDPRWDDPKYDWLGEFYSSHVNPIFWRLHGWVDDRIDDWFAAHEEAHPGQVVRMEHGGVTWFARGRWVVTSDPWPGPPAMDHGHHGHGGGMMPGMKEMEEVMGILFPPPPPSAEPMVAGTAAPRVSRRRTWFGSGM